ncbi:hypothetical protein BLA39750_01188 [Burkholderia lata]|uniref:Uncharacterized protein n=1 Tax=Burkholderia lata (strain ATCC 17760 / DSM 23089 / LMG 22485 / NCIMB 9086 / R18194 / 383) TaxID=482957 RepID=A0A6P2UZF9_BURL3|nr:hypothetical protein [Burkholderia lata]VWC80878.1 hypothetical protein BLA39750_01188 [Burkholderia lata]
MKSNQVQQQYASSFAPGVMSALGRNSLEAAGLPSDFEGWLSQVEERTKSYAKRTAYGPHWVQGRTPDEAVELVAADEAAEEIARVVCELTDGAYLKLSPKHLQYGARYIKERVLVLMQHRI